VKASITAIVNDKNKGDALFNRAVSYKLMIEILIITELIIIVGTLDYFILHPVCKLHVPYNL